MYFTYDIINGKYYKLVFYIEGDFMRKSFLILLLFILPFTSCQRSNKIDPSNIDSAAITALPSPPQVKTITEEKDIESIISFVNSINKRIGFQGGEKGWEFLIEMKGRKQYSFTFIGNRMRINKIWYKIDKDELKKLRELYNEMDYKEEPLKVQ